jgi:hypothetical protein
MGIGTAVVTADWVALASLWEAPHNIFDSLRTFCSLTAISMYMKMKGSVFYDFYTERSSDLLGFWTSSIVQYHSSF